MQRILGAPVVPAQAGTLERVHSCSVPCSARSLRHSRAGGNPVGLEEGAWHSATEARLDSGLRRNDGDESDKPNVG